MVFKKNKKNRRIVQYLVFFVLALSFMSIASIAVSAKQMVLLAVSQDGDKLIGSSAALDLEIRPGSGRVFLETYSLSKLDTQISTRFAKSIACNYIDFDCNNYDFFYSIKSDSVIVGGPSAGSSIALLTIFKLQGLDFDEKVALTGTINSGGFIGPVSGLKEKIAAAKNAGVKKVLIPKGQLVYSEVGLSDNLSVGSGNLSVGLNPSESVVNLSAYGKELGVEVIEISEIDDAVFEFTGKPARPDFGMLEIDPAYQNTMASLSMLLCNRSKSLRDLVDVSNPIYKNESYFSLLNSTESLLVKSADAYGKKDYYSSASFCFGSNINYRFLVTSELSYSKEDIIKRAQAALEEAETFEKKIGERNLNSITDLQAYMIVKERIDESKENFKDAIKHPDNTESLRKLTYGTERLYSAYSWSYFFNNPGTHIDLDNDALKVSCLDKMSEAEERRQYLALMLPQESLILPEKEGAYSEYNKSNYKMCLFKASKEKAELDIILSLIGVEEAQLKEVILRKQLIAEKLISKQQKKAFPILGYSYLEYSKNLIDDEPYASLLYAEYALELSNLDLYFKEEPSFSDNFKIEKIRQNVDERLLYLIAGFLIALLILGIVLYFRPDKKSRKSKK
ncbi:MAG: S16 family serine protease [Nanoarchaeota archaeon]|nr:S16 family serine protease [Nanoarchaeota archaeon]